MTDVQMFFSLISYLTQNALWSMKKNHGEGRGTYVRRSSCNMSVTFVPFCPKSERVNKNQSGGSRSVPCLRTDRWAGMTKSTVVFCFYFTTSHKMYWWKHATNFKRKEVKQNLFLNFFWLTFLLRHLLLLFLPLLILIYFKAWDGFLQSTYLKEFELGIWLHQITSQSATGRWRHHHAYDD